MRTKASLSHICYSIQAQGSTKTLAGGATISPTPSPGSVRKVTNYSKASGVALTFLDEDLG